MLSFGVIACKVPNCRLDVSKERPPEEILSFIDKELPVAGKTSEMISQIAPAAIKKAIEPCPSDSPTARPDMNAVVRALEGFLSDFNFDIFLEEEKRLRWTYWDCNQSCYEGRRRTTSSIDRASTGSSNTDLFRAWNLRSSCCNYPVTHAYVLNYSLNGPNARQPGEPTYGPGPFPLVSGNGGPAIR